MCGCYGEGKLAWFCRGFIYFLKTVSLFCIAQSSVKHNNTQLIITIRFQIQVLPEGGETPIFKQFFRDWKDKDQSDGFGKVYVTEKVARIEQVEFDATKLHESPQMAAQHNMVDDGSGKVEVQYGCSFVLFLLFRAKPHPIFQP